MPTTGVETRSDFLTVGVAALKAEAPPVGE
jgi:hypothetical protein